jgi:uncharacterized protein YjeT (DUF2065 family)
VNTEIGRALFGLVEFAIGLVTFTWPHRVRKLSLSREVRVDKTTLRRDVVVVWRLVGLAFMTMGVVVMYSALTLGASQP